MNACFIAYIVQAIINNFVPLLFLRFQEGYGIPLSKITLLVTVNFGIQLTVDLASAGFVDKIGYRASMLIAHICAAAGFDPQKLTASSQDHHTVIRRVTTEQAGIGFTRPRDLESVDGLCTDTPGLTLVTYYADCVPLFFADKRTHAVGAAHSGWRGTVARIGAEMVRRMGEEFSSDPADLIVGIGPSIGPECYEVDQPVADQFLAMQDLDPERFVRPIGEGKYLLDLWECNRRVLASAGIPEENISCAQLCTKCHPDLLYSHRVMGAQRGNLAAMICRREDD